MNGSSGFNDLMLTCSNEACPSFGQPVLTMGGLDQKCVDCDQRLYYWGLNQKEKHAEDHADGAKQGR